MQPEQSAITQLVGERFLNNETPVQMIAVGVVLLGAYVGGRIFHKLKLSDVTGQMLGGALVGPYALHTLGVLGADERFYDVVMHGFSFFVFVYLCLVAFGIGEELHVSRLKQVGLKSLLISVVHSFLTFGFIALGLWGLGGMSILKSLVLASIGVTSAPAIAFVMMNKMRIEGHLRHMAASVLVMTDLIGIFLFSLFTQIALRSKREAMEMSAPLLVKSVVTEIGIACLIGFGIFLLLKFFVHKETTIVPDEDYEDLPKKQRPFLQEILAAQPSPSAEILLITMGTVALGTGIAYYFHLPFLISAVLAGFLVANYHSFAIFDSLKIDTISAMFNLMFFAMVGASMSLASANSHTLWLAFIYIATRSLGKMAGTYFSCRAVNEKQRVCRALPAQLMPQTGVAAVEAVFVGNALGESELEGIVLIGIVFFGIAGVVQVERALEKFKEAKRKAKAKKEIKKEASNGVVESARKILGYISPDSIKLDLDHKTKRGVIRSLVRHASKVSKQHIDQGQTLHMIMEREELAPTGVGHGIALPHCRMISLEQPVIVLGLHKKGVVFGGMDDAPSRLIMLTLTSGRNPSEHLQIMAASSHLFNNNIIRTNMMNAKSSEELLQVIIDCAEGFDNN